MRRPDCNNQVRIPSWSYYVGLTPRLCRSSSLIQLARCAPGLQAMLLMWKVCLFISSPTPYLNHVLAAENLVIRHRRPVTLPFPNAYSHALPRFAYNANTKEVTVTFASDPSYPAGPESRRESMSAAWKEKTYYLSSVPVRKPPTLIDNASALLTSAMSGPLALFGGAKTNATPDMVFDGEIDLAEGELAEQDRNEAEEVDDSPDPLRPVKVVALHLEEVAGSSDAARLRRQWEILPLRQTKHRTGV